MGGLRGRPSKGQKLVKPLMKAVKAPSVEENKNRQKVRNKELPKASPVEEIGQVSLADRKTNDFATIEVTGSKGQKYKIVVPASYAEGVPKKWKWTPERYRVAELIAEGLPLSQIPDDPHVSIKSRMVIYCWLEHPEFRDHIDGLIMETGWANRRERINNLKRLNEVVLNKVLTNMDAMKLTDKNVGALLSSVHAIAKLIAQEKGEFVEESKVSSEVTMDAKVINVEAKIDDILNNAKTDEERREMEQEFDKVGNDIIRAITGSKD